MVYSQNLKFCGRYAHAGSSPAPGTMNKSMPKFTVKYVARFWNRVAKGAFNKCWEWQGYTFNNGYGGFKAFYKNWLAHRKEGNLQSQP